jgi:hypothetical protein
MAAKEQSLADGFTKLAVANTAAAAGKPCSQADAEAYNILVANGTATPTKIGISQGIAEAYHKLNGA